MGKYLTRLEGHFQNDERYFVVTAPLIYEFDRARLTCTGAVTNLATVNPPFPCDLASIPSVTAPFAAPFRHTAAPGATHDYNYFTGLFSRRDADEIFQECLLSQGVDPIVARRMFHAVRLFGRKAWARHRSNDSAATVAMSPLIATAAWAD